MKIETLTDNEIETLQVDAALRLIGKYGKQLNHVNHLLSNAIMQLGNARLMVDRIKNDKQLLIESIRALKIIVERA